MRSIDMVSPSEIEKPLGSPQRLPNGECGGEFVKGLERQRPLTNGGGDSPPTPCAERGGATDLIITAQVTPAFRAVLQERQRRALKARRRYRLYDLKSVARIAALGMGRGFVQNTPVSGSWDVSGDCAKPVPVQFDAASSKLSGNYRVRIPGQVFGLTMITRCRRCVPCLRKRAAHWAYRATEEIAGASRTWFATFTFSPHNHSLMTMRASARLRPRGVDLALLPVEERIREVGAEYTRELTLWVKRIRKNSGAALRYMLVQEQHKSGLPHFHAVIHETSQTNSVRHATLTAAWKLGFSKFKLVEGPKTAWYVAKYLAKDVLARVRASIGYGKDGLSRREYGEAYPKKISPSEKPSLEKVNEAFTESIKSDMAWLQANTNLLVDRPNPEPLKGKADAECPKTCNLSSRSGGNHVCPPDAPDPPRPGRSAATENAYRTTEAISRALKAGSSPLARSAIWTDAAPSIP